MLSKGVLAANGGLVTAFSRGQDTKVYVTQRLAETAAKLWDLLQQASPCLLESAIRCILLLCCTRMR